MQDVERIQSRLENIRAVRPILGALRTISLGSWQMALSRQKKVARYRTRLLDVLPPVLAQIHVRRKGISLKPVVRQAATYWSRLLDVLPSGMAQALERQTAGGQSIGPAGSVGPATRVVVLVIGSERGLCGRFNIALADYVAQYLAERAEANTEVTALMALGSRLVRILQRRRERSELAYALDWTRELSATTLPSFDLAFDLTHHWLAQYEAEALDAVNVLYNAYGGSSEYTPSRVRLIPPELPQISSQAHEEAGGQQVRQIQQNPPVIETDPLRLYARAIEQLTAIRFHELLLESAASEHATRFRLMESATQNADRLVDELTMQVQSARRQAITREMQELAVGAGLLGSQE